VQFSQEIYQLLEEKHYLFNQKSFIESDPISIPHLFSKKEDIEIAAFLAATIAWGQRKTIIKNAQQIVELMDMDPHQFVINHSKKDLKRFTNFKHRTFNSIDIAYFIQALQNIYNNHKGIQQAIAHFKTVFFEIEHPKRTTKHISDPLKNSAAKRINMFLRWMARKDNTGVDFGIWKSINPANLMCPLDVHSGNVARKLGLLPRAQNDWKAVDELTANLRNFDKNDPIKYDFSLFGLGVFEKF
jgi:uncharacterized protein (TIGR02757 family)